MNTREPDWSAELEARLRREAETWGGEPSVASTTALQEQLARLPRRRRRGPLLAAAVAFVAVTFAVWNGSAPTPAEPHRDTTRDRTETDMGPLERELHAVTADANAIAHALFARVPDRLRGLIPQR